MIKRDITETTYEYDNEGKLIRKTITETHEEESEKATISTYQSTPYLNQTHSLNDNIVATNDMISNKMTNS